MTEDAHESTRRIQMRSGWIYDKGCLGMLSSRLQFVACFLISLSTVCCRSPEDVEPPSLYYTDFDASVPDGGDVAPVAACAENGQYTFDNNFSPYFGGEAAVDVEVVQFSSFYCTHCADFAAFTKARWQSRSDFQDRVRVYFHHANLGYRHRAAVAAAAQGMENFWKLHDFIYVEMLSGRSLSDTAVRAYAENELHLDMKRFDEDADSPETDAFLKWDINQGFSAGMIGTPTVFVCGDPVDNWTYLEDYIDARL